MLTVRLSFLKQNIIVEIANFLTHEKNEEDCK